MTRKGVGSDQVDCLVDKLDKLLIDEERVETYWCINYKKLFFKDRKCFNSAVLNHLNVNWSKDYWKFDSIHDSTTYSSYKYFLY